MQSFNIRKQLFGGKSINQKPGLFALAVAAGYRKGEGLMEHGAPRWLYPSFSKRSGSKVLLSPMFLPPRSHQGGFGR